ncbi:hypothetical protein GCM10023321_80410 [Pseudonocardia eucalypti]|uniref:Uncharacterized protein n=1 Tax=Pseudonocardia eucalypti TaxID=648755 RepID=A0ABP9RCH8_9PSEU
MPCFSGLSDPKTVRHYRNCWQQAIDAGLAPSVKPGDRIDEPEMDWPPNPDPKLHAAGYENPEERATAIRRRAEELGGPRARSGRHQRAQHAARGRGDRH